MNTKLKNGLGVLGARISCAAMMLSAGFTTMVSADDIFGKADSGLKDIYSKLMGTAPVLIAVLAVIALLAWLFWPSSKGAEKGKTWFVRILAGLIGLLVLGLIFSTMVNIFGGNNSAYDFTIK